MSETDGSALLGLDNIRLDLPIAGVGSRVLAAAVDQVLVIVLQILWIIAASAGGALAGSGAGLAALGIGLFAIDWGYFAGFEIALGGRTPGKRAVGLRVVSRRGGTPDRTDLLLRNLVRIADLLVAVPMIALDPAGRRLGDRIAGTRVIHDRPHRAPVLARVPHGWGPREVALAERYFERRGELEPDQALFLGRRLVAWVERDQPELLAGTDPARDPGAALERALVAPASPGTDA